MPDESASADDSPTHDSTDHDATDGAHPRPRRTRRRVLWVLAGVVAVVALGYGAILIYAHLINDPADELTVDDLEDRLADPDEGAAGDLDGTWRATEASELGYRVAELLFGVTTEGVGRTDQVTGTLTIAGTRVTEAAFEVDVASIESDDPRRDGQFRGRIMSVVDHPTATFTLTEPIELQAIPGPGEQVSATATGDLTLRGVTNAVTFEVTAQHRSDRIGVLGTIPITFADYDIVNPSIAGVTTEDHGLLEFVLVFER